MSMFALKDKTHSVDYDSDTSLEVLDLEIGQALPADEAQQSSLRTALRRLSPSVIAEDVALKGNVVAKGEIQLEGEVHGDLHCAALEIGTRGLVVGTVIAADVVVCGRVRGPIKGEHVTLTASADVEGDISHTSLSIEQGARFEGRAQRNRPQAEAAQPARRAEYLPSPPQQQQHHGAGAVEQHHEPDNYDRSVNGAASPEHYRGHPDAAA